MYERFYGLRERAFELTPDPRYLLLTPAHREALGNVDYGIAFRRSCTLLLGGAGTGKTTILRTALAAQIDTRGARLQPIYVNNPTLTRQEFLEMVANQVGLSSEAHASKARFLREIEAALLARHARGETTVLVIDEVQSLPAELLEEVRLLGNIESDTDKLLPVVLAGQPEFAERLNEPGLRQLKQRVALRCTLPPLTPREVAAYVAGRLRLAGGDPAAVFTRDAVLAIAHHSGGIPRTISVICDNALLNGFALERRPVDEQLVEDVCGDFDLGPAQPGSALRRDRSPAPDPPRASKIRPFVTASVSSQQPGGSEPTEGSLYREQVGQ